MHVFKTFISARERISETTMSTLLKDLIRCCVILESPDQIYASKDHTAVQEEQYNFVSETDLWLSMRRVPDLITKCFLVLERLGALDKHQWSWYRWGWINFICEILNTIKAISVGKFSCYRVVFIIKAEKLYLEKVVLNLSHFRTYLYLSKVLPWGQRRLFMNTSTPAREGYFE